MTYASRVAQEVRQEWEAEKTSKRLKKNNFSSPLFGTKTLHLYQGIRQAPFTVTDGTTGFFRDIDTKEEALKVYQETKTLWESQGWSVVK